MTGTDFAPAIEKIASLVAAKKDAGASASATKFIHTTNEPYRYGILAPGKAEIEWRDVAPRDRQYKASSLDAIVDIAKAFQAKAAEPLAASSALQFRPAVFSSLDRVTLFFDEVTRRERVDFEMDISETWARLKGEFETDGPDVGEWIGQRDMIDLIRLELNAQVTPADLVTSLRQVRMASTGTGESVVSNAKESVGRSIQAEISGTGVLPEDVTLSVPVHDNVRLDGDRVLVNVKCDFAVRATDATFRLRPKGGEISIGEIQVLASISKYLRDAFEKAGVKCPVFEGSA